METPNTSCHPEKVKKKENKGIIKVNNKCELKL